MTLPLASLAPAPLVGTLYGDHHRWLVGWLRARLGCSHQAADLAQDTFVRLLQAERAQRLNAPLDQPRHFLVTIARRVMVDSFRRRAVEQAYLRELAEWPEAEVPSPQERLILIETLQAIDRMLDGLGEKAKRAFLMAQLQGLGYKLIAAELGVSVSSVTKYIARATEHCLLFALEQEL
ncbi:putative RNA polymerase sigma factor FecI [Pseudomonas reidholzensis]|uniref:Putative RNA polymerase sigma factor FecI n=1 Tax=Pseudomonas reidholzensis TaxID=1785162 RepID=A0A383RPB0_9PSED|nr:sigma-70 family RNA polymerase sigma factor [Pseudomonas reidholzensis]SYX88890.1 putative RNA polymerase sigma factor FecI [Pseudomonas reidholzensis]